MSIDENLVDIVWGDQRPPRPSKKVIVLGLEYAGKPFINKLEDLRKDLVKKESCAFIICMSTHLTLCNISQYTMPTLFLGMLDEIAWLYNLRGSE